ncbi:P-loop containing nucleoside triphosphate hydrolase protein [Lipomyces starkeyi]
MQSQPLSQGQQQLFTLARALLHRSSILLLDEGTSNVDVTTDALMQRIIREEFAACTIITVAHRMNSITDVDMVVVLEKGRIVEAGDPIKARNYTEFTQKYIRTSILDCK